jgi:hypothetical protein
MPKLSALRCDLKKEVEGVWCTYPVPGADTSIECLIARIGNKNYNQEVERLTQKWLDEHPSENSDPGKRIPPDVMEDIYIQAVSMFVLLDWRNVLDDDDEDLAYTPEEGLKILRDEEFHDFQTWVFLQAGSRVRYRKISQDESVKNSSRSSSGPTSGESTSSGSRSGQDEAGS